MLRSRDILALVGTLILFRSAWNNGTESLSATADLAFFAPREGVMVLSPMDVDGDGTKEALAVVKAVPEKESFTLQIMDLKLLHGFRKIYLEPFRPKVIFASEEINDDNAHPIHLTTGQLLIQKTRHSSSPVSDEKEEKDRVSSDQSINDQTRHYFCGTDWHDASSKCSTPCPNGQANECPNDERCFADTPCDVLKPKFDEEESQKSMFELTPGGGLPSVVSLWTNGVVILHSLTNIKTEEDNAKKNKPLELREMWRYRIFPTEKADDMVDILWEEINVVFLDAYSSIEGRAQHGMLVVSASYFLDGDPESDRSTFTVAIDAFKGTSLWESHSDVGLDTDEKPLPLPLAKRGQTSFARRRSSVARYMQGGQSTTSASALPNCMSLLKKAVKNEIFPYSYWGPQDAGVAAIHLNQKKKSRDDINHRASKPHEEQLARPNNHLTKRWHHKFHRRKKDNRYNQKHEPVRGKPNALVTQTRGGLQIRSLRNGKALCHLALTEEKLYSDLNNDGVLDQVQAVLHTKTHKPSDKFIWNLAGKLHQQHQELEQNGSGQQKTLESRPQLCHILALSGIPAREEIFSAPICGKVHERTGLNAAINLDSVNPLVVESMSRRGNKHDIIIALNNGMIHRIDGSGGRRMWALSGTHRMNNFPTWEEESNRHALLTRIQLNKVIPPLRPLLLTGQNSLAIISVTTGNILASAAFPQKCASRPILADLSGDGSTDVVILTADGIWGYQIIINRGSPVTLRLLVGLLLVVLMLGTIRNRYSKGGKRSTDE